MSTLLQACAPLYALSSTAEGSRHFKPFGGQPDENCAREQGWCVQYRDRRAISVPVSVMRGHTCHDRWPTSFRVSGAAGATSKRSDGHGMCARGIQRRSASDPSPRRVGRRFPRGEGGPAGHISPPPLHLCRISFSFETECSTKCPHSDTQQVKGQRQALVRVGSGSLLSSFIYPPPPCIGSTQCTNKIDGFTG